jgi:hypothetical protein
MTNLPFHTDVACSLEQADLATRRTEWREVAGSALLETRRLDSGVRLVFAASAETERALRDLAALERECCGFAAWSVERSGDELALEVTSSGEGIAAVQAMMGALAQRRG